MGAIEAFAGEGREAFIVDTGYSANMRKLPWYKRLYCSADSFLASLILRQRIKAKPKTLCNIVDLATCSLLLFVSSSMRAETAMVFEFIK